jgi:O-antigen/teichoic acid export membrane protein
MGPHPQGSAVSKRWFKQREFARLLSSAMFSQALLSAASFLVGLLLVRGTSDTQYGYYILCLSAIVLLVSLQNAMFNPPLAIGLNRLEPKARSELVGGLYQAQRRMLERIGFIAIVLAIVLWIAGILDARTGPLALAVVAAALAVLHREYFRMVLMAYRRAHDVLRTDLVHVGLLLAGVGIALSTPAPAAASIVAVAVAATASGILLARRLRRHEAWTNPVGRAVLREAAPLAAWSTAGAAIHWSFSQGYIYLVAGTLDVGAVAAIAATRLLFMPVNLVSTGIGSLMLPLASGWLHRHGTALLWRRLCALAAIMIATTLCYFALVWWSRDWLFAVVLKKQFAQRDALVLLWAGIFLATVVRDQLVYLLAAQGRFRTLTGLTLAGAIVSLAVGYWGMLQFGVSGALTGLLIGELISVLGISILSVLAVQSPLVAAG